MVRKRKFTLTVFRIKYFWFKAYNKFEISCR